MDSKSLFSFAVVSAVAAFVSFGCSKGDDALSSAKLTADQESIVVEKYDENIAFNLSWDEVGGASKYFVQFTADSDPEFLKAYVKDAVDGTSLAVTYDDMKAIHNSTGVLSDYQLLVRVLSEAEGVTSSYSNKVRVNVGFAIWPDIDMLYLCGDACAGSWNIGTVPSVHFTPRNGLMYDVYEWEGKLTAGGGFRINTKDNWFPSIMKSTVDGAPVYVGSSSIYYEDESLYEHFSVSETGVYAVTVDLTDFKAIKVDIVKK